ncbi:MAG: hypothetical protein D6689_17310, partial [Deltaproteobacteria bacterium]
MTAGDPKDPRDPFAGADTPPGGDVPRLEADEADIDAWADLFDALHESEAGAEDTATAGGGQGAAAAAGGDAGDDDLDFLGDARALGAMLGSLEPPPLAAPDGSDGAAGAEAQAAPPAPPRRPSRPSIEFGRAPSLAEGPSDDELFGDLPDAVPVNELSADPAPVGAPGGEATRVASPFDLPLAAARPEAPQPGAPRPDRRGAAIVRREDLERRRDAADGDLSGEGDFDGGEVTRIASAELLESMAGAAREFDDGPPTAEREVAVVVDDDFYDDIEIEAPPAGGEPAGAAPVESPAAVRPSVRRLNAHIARRRAGELSREAAGEEAAGTREAGEGPVIEIEAEPSDRLEARPAPQVVEGTTSGDGDDVFASFELGAPGA